MKPYPQYKDSGQPWLGPIPEHWKLMRAKWLFDEVSEKNHPDKPLLSATQDKGVYPRDLSENRVMMPMGELDGFKLVRPGEFVISLRSFEGGIEHSAYEGLISPAYTVLMRRRQLSDFYFKYLLKSSLYVQELNTAVTGIRDGQSIRYKDFGEARLPFPSLPEQTAIVAYLDRKTVGIERFITKKRQLIALLNEQKTAIINRAVTKGLNPEVPMRASGVEWLGEVPAHWEIKHLKYLFSEVDRRTTTGEEGLLSLRLRQGLIDDPKLAAGLIQPKDLIGYKITEPGEVVMNRMQASNGLFGLTPRYGLVSPDYAVFKAGCDVVPNYFIRLFNMNQMRTKFRQESKGLGDGSSGFLRLYSDRFGGISSAVPPTDEQASIVAYIDAENAVVNTVISRIEREIELIQEYRTTLISDAVTGKIDVRGVTDTENTAVNLTR